MTSLLLSVQAMASRPKRKQPVGGGGGAETTPPVITPDEEAVSEADEEENEELMVSDVSADEHEQDIAAVEPPPAAAEPARGRGRGKGRGRGRAAAPAAAPAAGRGGRGRGRGRGRGAATGTVGYDWVDAKDHRFTDRVAFEGSKETKLSAAFDGLNHRSQPHEFFKIVDAPEEEYQLRAANSEKLACVLISVRPEPTRDRVPPGSRSYLTYRYRSWRFGNDMDGPGKRCYDGAAASHVRRHLLVCVVVEFGSDIWINTCSLWCGKPTEVNEIFTVTSKC